MEDYLIDNFEMLWTNDSSLVTKLKHFETIYKILSTVKLKNETIWAVMQKWMSVDTANRLTHFKQLFKECLQFNHDQSRQLIEDEIFQSDIFKLLPADFRQELREFSDTCLQLRDFHLVNEETPLSTEGNQSSDADGANVNQSWQIPLDKAVSLPATVTYLVRNETKQLLVCFNKDYGLVEFYDPQHHSWHSSPVSLKLPNEQANYQLALLGSVLFAFGGTNKSSSALNQVWSRDLSDASSEWKARADMNKCRELHCSVVLNDTIYVMGGADENDDRLSSCERYSSQLNQWSTVAHMKTCRAAASAAVLNGCIYIAGGWSKKGVVQSVEKYDPQSNEWSQVAPMATARCDFALTSFAGRLWAIGGLDDDINSLSLVESYDPVTDSWREEASLIEKRWDHAAIEFNGELYVVGGVKEDDRVVEKYVPTIGWVEDSALQKRTFNPQLTIIPPAYSSFFTTASKK